MKFEDFPQKNTVFSHDKKLAAAWKILQRRSDYFDEDTYYEIAVWDIKTKERITSFIRSYEISRSSGNIEGKPLKSISFSQDSKELLILFEDGSIEKEALDKEHCQIELDTWED